MSLVDDWAREELEALDAAGLRRQLEPLDSPQGAVVTVGGRRYVNFASNDYLGFSRHEALSRAAASALERHGAGAGASRLVTGDTAAHRSLERALAAFEGTEAALLFNSGYAANSGAVPALVAKDDVVFSDALNHASLVDGCRLSRAQVVVFPHRDVAALEALMAKHLGRRRLVVTDSVFSMDGDVAPLAALRRLCDAHDVGLLVDEAHGTGVLGPTGRGGCEAAGVTADVLIGTLSKALGSFGAYVAGSAALYDLVLNRARSLVFSTALPAAVCAASEAAVALLQRSPELRAKLGRNVQHFAAGLRAVLPKGAEAPAVWLGAGEATWETTIFSVVLGSPERALDAAARLRDAGVLVKAIRPPTVPEGTSRLRFAVTAAHEPVQLSFTLEALSAVLKPSTVSRSTSPSPRTNANPNPTPAFPS